MRGNPSCARIERSSPPVDSTASRNVYIPELGESCIPAACAFSAAPGLGVRSLSGCLRGWNQTSRKVEKTTA